jgi:nucleoid-associated protein YgaU
MVGLSSWVITATLVGTGTYTTTMTNALGYYVFPAASLKAAGMAFPGATIEVCEEVRYNWIAYTPKCVRVTFPYPVPDGYTGARVDFTNYQDPPIGVSSYVVPTTTASAGCSASYTVQRGDTLARIAASQGTSVSAITRASGITNPNLIRTGQTLCVR